MAIKCVPSKPSIAIASSVVIFVCRNQDPNPLAAACAKCKLRAEKAVKSDRVKSCCAVYLDPNPSLPPNMCQVFASTVVVSSAAIEFQAPSDGEMSCVLFYCKGPS